MLSNHGLISKKLPVLTDTSVKSMQCLPEGGFSFSSCRTLRRPGQARVTMHIAVSGGHQFWVSEGQGQQVLSQSLRWEPLLAM